MDWMDTGERTVAIATNRRMAHTAGCAFGKIFDTLGCRIRSK